MDKILEEIKDASMIYERGLGFYLKDYPVLIEVSVFNNRLHLSSIFSLETGKGYSSLVMKWLIGLADKYHVDIELYPTPFGTPNGKKGMPLYQLKKWYKRLGFITDKRDVTMMVYHHKE